MDIIESIRAKIQKHDTVFIAPNATLIGQIIIGAFSSIWFGVVIRAEYELVTIGEQTNIQDNSVIHVDPGSPVDIGNDVIIGHRSIIHGCTIGNNTLIGMGSVILNNVRIGNNCLIGANTLITEGMIIPDYSMVVGSPGKIVKIITVEQVNKIKQNALNYVQLAKAYKACY